MGVATEQQRLAQAIRNPGRLVLGPTATTGAFPYGGVSLGRFRDGDVIWHVDYNRVRDPASGRITEVGRNGADFPEIYCLVEQMWDEDVLFGIFQRATRAANLPFQSPEETRVEGANVAVPLTAWPPVLLAADDPAHKSIYFRRPIPTLSLESAWAISMDRGAGLPVRFVPSPDTQWQSVPDWQCCRLENMVL